MNNRPIISIIIPTYNRYKYLMGSIDAMTETIPDSDIEIVVQDNTEKNDTIIDYLEKLNDFRVKYHHEAKRITVSENCSNGILNSSGKYVCIIGDDDAVCSDIVELAIWMDKVKIDACNFDPAIYHWPDLLQLVESLDAMVTPQIKCKIEFCDSKKVLREEIKQGLQRIYDFPRAYHAIISRDVLDVIYSKTGTFFPGPSPDMANAALCCLYVKNQIKIGIPMMVSGYCSASTGGMGRQRKHKGSLKDKDWLPKDVEEKWDKKIPLLWLGCTIWPDSAVEALKRVGAEDMLSNINYGIIYGETIIQMKGDGIAPVFKCKPSIVEFIVMAKHIVCRILRKVFSKGQNKESIINNNVTSLKEAVVFQNDLNKEANISELFEKFVLEKDNK